MKFQKSYKSFNRNKNKTLTQLFVHFKTTLIKNYLMPLLGPMLK